MYYYEDIGNMKDVPKQTGGINCGVCTLWHLLFQCFQSKEVVDLVIGRFQDQCLLYIYQFKTKTPNYTFSESFNWYEVIVYGVPFLVIIK